MSWLLTLSPSTWVCAFSPLSGYLFGFLVYFSASGSLSLSVSALLFGPALSPSSVSSFSSFLLLGSPFSPSAALCLPGEGPARYLQHSGAVPGGDVFTF